MSGSRHPFLVYETEETGDFTRLFIYNKKSDIWNG